MVMQRGSLWLLMFALVAAQSLGLVHRVVDAPVQGVFQAHALVEPSGVDAHFFGHEDEADCRLYDQLSHGDSTVQAVQWAVPTLLPAFIARFFQRTAVARWAAVFEARAPPAIR